MPNLHVVKRTTAPTRANTSLYYHAEGDPRSWLIAICQALPRNRNLVKLIRLLWQAYRTHLLDPEDFTMDQVLAARTALNIPLKEGTLKDAFGLLEELFWRLNTKRQDAFINQKNPQGGRPKDHYQAIPLVEVEPLLGQWAAHRIEEQWYVGTKTIPNLNPEMAQAVSGDARRAALEAMPQLPPASDQTRSAGRNARQDLGALVRSLKDITPVSIPLDCDDIRAALFSAENDPEQAKGYRDVMREYGVSLGNVKKLVARAGMRVVKQTVDCPITSIETFEQEVSQARKEKRGFPILLVERSASGGEVEHPYSPTHMKANRRVIEAAYQAGNSVHVRLRTKSKYEAIDAAQAHNESTPSPTMRRSRRDGVSPVRPYYGTGYNPDIVLRWLKTHLRQLGWHERPDGIWVDRYGEKYDLRRANPQAEDDRLIAFGESLGAVVTKLKVSA